MYFNMTMDLFYNFYPNLSAFIRGRFFFLNHLDFAILPTEFLRPDLRAGKLNFYGHSSSDVCRDWL